MSSSSLLISINRRGAAFELPADPDSSKPHAPVDGGRRHPQRFGDLQVAQSAEVVKLDHPAESLVSLPEALQSFVHGDQVVSRLGDGGGVMQRDPDAPLSFLGLTRPSVIHEHPPHQPRRHAEKMGPIPPRQIETDHPSEGLVHDCRRLESVSSPLASHLDAREPPELVVHQGQQLPERRFVSFPPPQQ